MIYTPKTKEELQDLVDDLNINLGDIDVSNITDMSDLFYNTKRTNFDGIENWDVSNVDNMSFMFRKSPFNGDISAWDVSNVEDIHGMFYNTPFNGDLSNWDVSNVKDMSFMFYNTPFNGDVSKWDVSKVEDMNGIFYYSPFNGDISNWNVSKVENMSYMFYDTKFNGDVSRWDVSNVENMSYMFENSPFNGDISKWDVFNVKNMRGMFENSKFNQDISNWRINKDCDTTDMFLDSNYGYEIPSKITNKFKYTPENREELLEIIYDLEVHLGDIDTSNITDMRDLFWGSIRRNFDGIEKWNVSNVGNMSGMFNESYFDEDISNWDVSNVTNMSYMFANSDFNQDISNWKVSNVRNMNGMFENTYHFNQDISNWDVSNVKDMTAMFAGSNFNQDISNWKLNKDCKTENMFAWSDYEYEKASFKYMPKTKEELQNLVDNLDVYLGDIDTSNITDMSDLFYDTERINFDGIETWDVSNVKYMSFMFYSSEFNGDISNWDVHNVENMRGMFEDSVFNQDISDWDVSKVRDMEYMFKNSKFRQDISNWRINKDCKTENMFSNGYYQSAKYNPKTKGELQDLVNDLDVNLGDIDVSNITDMSGLFDGSKREDFNGIETWDVSKVENMSYMFSYSSFNQDISKWDVSKVNNMREMFYASNFNGDISKWNVSNVKSMAFMFTNTIFNKDISNWDVSNVEDMNTMFGGSKFNQDISKWNTTNVKDMCFMFGNSNFNQDISNWNISSVEDMNSMFANSDYSYEKPSKINDDFKYTPENSNELHHHILKTGSVKNIDISKLEDLDCVFALVNLDKVEGLKEIENWDTSNIVSMKSLFGGAYSKEITLNLSNWDTSDVKSMEGIFKIDANSNFRVDISNWDTSNVIDMSWAFASPIKVVGIENLDTKNVKNLDYCFYEHNGDNLDLSKWNTSKVESIISIFDNTRVNSLLIDKWDVSNVKDMNAAFFRFSAREVPNLSKWDTSNVENMAQMFEKSTIPTGLNNWDVSNVTNMSHMFTDSNISENLDKWNINKNAKTHDMFKGVVDYHNIPKYERTDLEKLIDFKAYNDSIIKNNLSDENKVKYMYLTYDAKGINLENPTLLSSTIKSVVKNNPDDIKSYLLENYQINDKTVLNNSINSLLNGNIRLELFKYNKECIDSFMGKLHKTDLNALNDVMIDLSNINFTYNSEDYLPEKVEAIRESLKENLVKVIDAQIENESNTNYKNNFMSSMYNDFIKLDNMIKNNEDVYVINAKFNQIEKAYCEKELKDNIFVPNYEPKDDERITNTLEEIENDLYKTIDKLGLEKIQKVVETKEEITKNTKHNKNTLY